MNELIFILQPVDMIADFPGIFYVIEHFHTPQFVSDKEGIVKTFNTYSEAKREADNCQHGYVITFSK